MSRYEPFLNKLQNRLSKVVSVRGDPPWAERLVLTEQVAATLNCAAPGTSGRRHPKHKAHNIRIIGDGPSLRLVILMPDVPHIDVETGEVFT